MILNNKTTCILLFCVLIKLSHQQACETNKCVGIGDRCDNQQGFSPVCPTNAYCNLTSGICEALATAGAYCYGDEVCDGFWEGLTVCLENKCTTIQFTQQEGQSCSVQQQCANKKLYCNTNNICTATPSKGDSCDENAVCAYGSFCNSATQVCTPLFSLPNGAACSGVWLCGVGSTCIYSNSTSGVCTVVPTPPSNSPCSQSGSGNSTVYTCSNPGEYCICYVDQSSGTASNLCTSDGITQEQANAIVSLQQCYNLNDCMPTDGISCCQKESCEYYNLYYKSVADDLICGVNYYAVCNNYPGGPPLTEADMIGIVVGCIGGAAVVVGLIAFFVRRRGKIDSRPMYNYSSIPPY